MQPGCTAACLPGMLQLRQAGHGCVVAAALCAADTAGQPIGWLLVGVMLNRLWPGVQAHVSHNYVLFYSHGC